MASLRDDFGPNNYKGDKSQWGLGSALKPTEDWSKPEFVQGKLDGSWT